MAKAYLIINLCSKLKCGRCDGVLIQLKDPALLAENDGQPIENAKYFIRGEVESFQEVRLNQSTELVYEYTISYESSLLLNPDVELQECDVKKVCCADCVIDYIDELTFAGTPPDPKENIINMNFRQAEVQNSSIMISNYYCKPMQPGAVDEEYWNIMVPLRWDINQNPRFYAHGIVDSVADGNLRFQLDYKCLENNQDIDTVPYNTILFTENIGDYAINANTIVSTLLNNIQLDRTKLIRLNNLNLRLRRLGTDALDTYSGNYNLFKITAIFPLSKFGATS